MVGELILFSACLILGMAGRAWFCFLLFLQKRVGKPAFVATEIVSGSVFGCLFLAILFFLGEGMLKPFAFAAVIVGIILPSLFPRVRYKNIGASKQKHD